jgi:hypothetical protein
MNEFAGEIPGLHLPVAAANGLSVSRVSERCSGACGTAIQLVRCKKPTFVKLGSSKDEPTFKIKAYVRKTNQR